MIDYAIKIQKLLNGKGSVKLSISQIVMSLVNVGWARKNLSPLEYNAIFNLFKAYKRCTKKIDMDVSMYLLYCEEIIKTFDLIAPFEKYSGKDKNDIEFAIFLQEIRDEISVEDNDLNNLHNMSKYWKREIVIDDIKNQIAEIEELNDYNRYLVNDISNKNNDDKCFLLVKIALDESISLYEKTIEKFYKSNAKVSIAMFIEIYDEILCENVLKKLDLEHQSKFIRTMRNPHEIDLIDTKIKLHLDIIGFKPGDILNILYYIYNIKPKEEKTSCLNDNQIEIIKSIVSKLRKKYNMT